MSLVVSFLVKSLSLSAIERLCVSSISRMAGK